MERKKRARKGRDALTQKTTIDKEPPAADGTEAAGEATADPPPDVPASAEASSADETRQWGDPYKSIFTCPEVGFELGENRRFRQRVFRFTERPNAEILAQLKQHGFTYRTPEKAWTITATPDTRRLTDELARQWAGPNYIQGLER